MKSAVVNEHVWVVTESLFGGIIFLKQFDLRNCGFFEFVPQNLEPSTFSGLVFGVEK